MKLYKEINKNPSIAWITEKIIDRRINSEYYDVSNLSQSEKLSSMEYISKYFDLSKKRFDPNKYKKQTFKYIDISNVDINTGKYEISVIDKFEAPSRARKKVDKGDILISTVRPNRNAVAIISENDEGLVASTGFAVLLSKDNIDRYYSFAALKNQFTIKQLIRKASGGMYPAIAEEEVMSLKIPIPSPEIQKYIGDKVRRAEELREEAKRLKDECEDTIVRELKKSCGLDNISYKEHAGKLSVDKIYDKQKSTFVSSKLIGNRIDPKFYHAEHVDVIKQISNIEHYSLKDTLKEYDTGVSQLKYSDRGIPVISTGNMNNNFIGDPEKYTISNIPNSKYLNEEDVLITTYGATSIGKVDIYDKTEVATFDYTLFRAKFGEEHPAYYMCLVLRTDLVQKQIKYSINSGGGTNFVNISSLLDIKIPKIKPQIMNVLNELMKKSLYNIRLSQQLILQAKQDVEDLIEGNFEMSELNKDSGTESRCKGA